MSLAMIIAVHSATLVRALRPLDFVMTQQLFAGMNELGPFDGGMLY